MKKLFILFIALLSVCISQKASAYHFYAVNDNGDTIYYGFTSDSTVAVVHEGRIWVDHGIYRYSGKKYKGNIVIPPTVSYNERTYTVSIINVRAFWDSEIISIILPETITMIDWDAFNGSKNLQSVTIPNSTLIIKARAFKGCGLQYVNIGNSVTIIEQDAFSFCSNLKTVIIGNSVQVIEDRAFFTIPFLIISYTESPPIIYENTFYQSGTIPILVPCESMEAYRTAPYWSDFDYNSCIGLEDIGKENLNIIVYPNPAKDNITIKTNQLNGGNLYIYDIMGRELTGKQINNDETIVDISSLNSGIYILKAISKDNKIVGNRKFIKQ